MVSRLFAILAFVSLVCLLGTMTPRSLANERDQGHFDLKKWDSHRNLNLDGHWRYLAGRMLEPQDVLDILQRPDEPVKILLAGESMQSEPGLPPYGSYFLRLKNPQNLQELAIFHGLYYSSARSLIFCREQPQRFLNLNLGQVGLSAASSIPKMSSFAVQDLRNLAEVSPCSELIVILQITSFHHDWAGMWLPPRLGRTAQFHEFIVSQERSYAFILGILLFVSFYGASFAVRRPEEKSAVFVAIGAFLLGLRIAVLFHAEQTEEGSTGWFWHFENLVVYSVSYLIPYLSLKSLDELSPGVFKRRWERILDILAVIALVIQVCLPVRIWTHFAGYFLIFGVFCVLLVITRLLKGMKLKIPGVWPLLLGVLFATCGMILEMLVVYRVIDYLPLNISGYGMAIWISLQLQLVAQRFADALKSSEYLTHHLQEEVEKKTQKLTELNRYIAENVLRRFLPPTVVADIVAGKRTLDEKAQSLVITVLFADLCDFTRTSTLLGPERTAAVLNSFLVRMTESVFDFGGTVDKFLGDGLLVLFGAPEPMPLDRQANAAWQCASRMLQDLEQLNDEWQRQGLPRLQLRIGMHCGPAVVGSFGGPMRSDYTAIGDSVNLASRIQAVAEPGSILITDEIAKFLPVEAIQKTAAYQLKGITEARTLFQICLWNSADPQDPPQSA